MNLMWHGSHLASPHVIVEEELLRPTLCLLELYWSRITFSIAVHPACECCTSWRTYFDPKYQWLPFKRVNTKVMFSRFQSSWWFHPTRNAWIKSHAESHVYHRFEMVSHRHHCCQMTTVPISVSIPRHELDQIGSIEQWNLSSIAVSHSWSTLQYCHCHLCPLFAVLLLL